MESAPVRLAVRRLDKAARLPTRAHADDLGWDLYSLEDQTIAPGALARLRTGVAIGFPPGVGGIVKDRSSLAGRGLHTLAGVIDPGYRGEILVVVANVGATAVQLVAGDRCAQLLLLRSIAATVEEVDAMDDTSRGGGGFGSTGR